MTRGNQRDLAREKNLKKQQVIASIQPLYFFPVYVTFLQEASKGQRADNLTPQQRREKCGHVCTLHDLCQLHRALFFSLNLR
jgi:hypothetical protein